MMRASLSLNMKWLPPRPSSTSYPKTASFTKSKWYNACKTVFTWQEFVSAPHPLSQHWYSMCNSSTFIGKFDCFFSRGLHRGPTTKKPSQHCPHADSWATTPVCCDGWLHTMMLPCVSLLACFNCKFLKHSFLTSPTTKWKFIQILPHNC